ncbi:hypothetical protein G6F57_022651 [Rhizopus arrhizus]|nr:hypothetical protein G6F57_022651 [Rhizopus arrhizus]
MRKGPLDAFVGKRLAQHPPTVVVVSNDGDARGIALVTGARMRQVINQNAHGQAPKVITSGVTQSRGSSKESTAMTSLAPRFTGPPAP